MGLLDTISQVATSLNPVTAIAGGISSIANGFLDRHAQKESNKRNAEQNELNRQFNAAEAEKNRQFQSAETAKQNAFNAAQSQLAFDRSAKFQQQMWKKENEYNTPLAQIKRLEQAGINPNVFGGDNTAGSVGSAVSPAASGSAPSGSVASAGSSIPNQPISYVNPLLEASQIRLNNAQSEKLGSDTDLNKANKDRIQQLLAGEVEGQRLDNFTKAFDLDKMKPQELRKLEEETNNLVQSCKNMDAELANIREMFNTIKQQENINDEQLRRMKIENQNFDVYMKAQIAQSLASVGLSQAQANLYAQEAVNAILEGGSLAIQFDTDNKTKDGKISIIKSDQEYTKYINAIRNQHPYMWYLMEHGDKIMNGIAGGLKHQVALGLRALFKR